VPTAKTHRIGIIEQPHRVRSPVLVRCGQLQLDPVPCRVGNRGAYQGEKQRSCEMTFGSASR
jgi:hypothetical protein